MTRKAAHIVSAANFALGAAVADSVVSVPSYQPAHCVAHGNDIARDHATVHCITTPRKTACHTASGHIPRHAAAPDGR